MLALTGALAREECRGDRLRGGDRGQFVGEDSAQQPRTDVVRTGLHRREPCEALDDRVVGRLCRIRPLLAKPADRDIDDLWRDRANRVLPYPEALGDTGAEVLDKD